jgi:molecular chaperone GrpE
MDKNKEILENEEQILQESAPSANEPLESTNYPGCSAEAEDLRESLANMTDKYMRAAAEIENTRRRAALDAENLARARAISVAENFLPIVDAITAALNHDQKNEGLATLARAADAALSKTGITRIETVGQPLNPMLHNAIQAIEVPVSDEPCTIKTIPNTIVGELQSGYMFFDTVLRTAMVVVAK